MAAKHNRHRVAWMLLAAAWLRPAGAQAPVQENRPLEAETSTSLQEAVEVEFRAAESEQEKQVNDTLRHIIATQSPVLGSVLKGSAQQTLSARQAALAALQRSLAIGRGKLRAAIATAASREAQAVFDPVIRVTFDYQKTDSDERIERDVKYNEGTRSGTDAEGVGRDNAIFIDEGPVDFIQFNADRPAGFYESRIVANEAFVTGALDQQTYAAKWIQNLPWGADFQFGLTAVHRDTFYVNNFSSRAAGLASVGSFERPWTATLSGQIDLPLPGSKDFGPFSALKVSTLVADQARQKAYWEVQAVINDTLLAVELAYWDLVDAVQQVGIAADHAAAVDVLMDRTRRLYELRQVTAYHKAQVEAAGAAAQSGLVAALQGYLRVRNALAELLDLEGEVVLLPAGYERLLTVPSPPGRGNGLPEEVTGNPALKQTAYDLAIARIRHQQRQRELRPDIRVATELVLAQTNQVFGYESLGESVSRLSDPDEISQRYRVVYQRPWANRAVKSRLVQAEAQVRQQQYRRDQAENRALRALNDALVNLDSAFQRVELAGKNVELAERQWQKALDRQASREVTEYELVIQSDALLTARRQYTRALIRWQQAKARALAAAGLLPGLYGPQTALHEWDRVRLRRLAEAGMLQHFVEVQP